MEINKVSTKENISYKTLDKFRKRTYNEFKVAKTETRKEVNRMFDKLKQIRGEKNISVDKMVEILGLETRAAYYKKELGNVRFSLNDARKISEFLNMSIEDIFFDDEVSETETIPD
ncbi:MAG: Helix-turn-helix domain protein [Firmicutes bacterium ADurb.Bin300]|nr:MAG: Helix-turn-helix domain protein [Firmicutes bacterium ADurb.Bin300]